MAAAPILRELFRAYRERLGDEDNGIVFEKPGERVDVFVYRAKDVSGITRFATLGPSVRPLPKTGERFELQFARRGQVTPEVEHAIAVQLANLSSHPWVMDSHYDWGHILGLHRPMPTFDSSSAVFLSGPLEPNGLVSLPTSEGDVKIFHVVPITSSERARAAGMSTGAFTEELLSKVDVLVDRPS